MAVAGSAMATKGGVQDSWWVRLIDVAIAVAVAGLLFFALLFLIVPAVWTWSGSPVPWHAPIIIPFFMWSDLQRGAQALTQPLWLLFPVWLALTVLALVGIARSRWRRALRLLALTALCLVYAIGKMFLMVALRAPTF